METIYAAAGEIAGLKALAHAWTERCLADAVAAHPFEATGLKPDHAERCRRRPGRRVPPSTSPTPPTGRCTPTMTPQRPIPALRPWTKDWLQRTLDQVTDALRVAKADGEADADVDPEAEAELFVSAGIGLALRWIVEDDLAHYDRGLLRLRRRFESLQRPA
jgi:hypothetical protein